jgi:cell division protein FtsB
LSATATKLKSQSTTKSDLRVIRRRGRSLIKRSGSRRTAPLVIVGCISVVAIIAGVLLTQVVLAQSAFKLQEINKRLAVSEERKEELLAEKALLESPGRIERYARTTLGMVPPTNIEYIVAEVRVGSDNRLADALKDGDLPLPGAASAVGSAP